jgi:hypothetical protein
MLKQNNREIILIADTIEEALIKLQLGLPPTNLSVLKLD